MMYKVGVWGPGSMGLIALRGVINDPQLHSSTSSCTATPRPVAMQGSCAESPRWASATKEAAPMLAGDADVVVYAAAANLRPADAIADMVSILQAGKNVGCRVR